MKAIGRLVGQLEAANSCRGGRGFASLNADENADEQKSTVASR